MLFMILPPVKIGCCSPRPVNSGVMPLCIKTEAELNGSTKEIYGDS